MESNYDRKDMAFLKNSLDQSNDVSSAERPLNSHLFTMLRSAEELATSIHHDNVEKFTDTIKDFTSVTKLIFQDKKQGFRIFCLPKYTDCCSEKLLRYFV